MSTAPRTIPTWKVVAVLAATVFATIALAPSRTQRLTVEDIITQSIEHTLGHARIHGEGTAIFNGAWFELPDGVESIDIPDDARLAGLVRGEDGELREVPPRFALHFAPQLTSGVVPDDKRQIPAAAGVVVYDSSGRRAYTVDPATGRLR
jgi:hypothetical protein